MGVVRLHHPTDGCGSELGTGVAHGAVAVAVGPSRAESRRRRRLRRGGGGRGGDIVVVIVVVVDRARDASDTDLIARGRTGMRAGSGGIGVRVVVVVVVVVVRATHGGATNDHLPRPRAVRAALRHVERRRQRPRDGSDNRAVRSVGIVGDDDDNYNDYGHLHRASRRRRLDAARDDDHRQRWRRVDGEKCRLSGFESRRLPRRDAAIGIGHTL